MLLIDKDLENQRAYQRLICISKELPLSVTFEVKQPRLVGCCTANLVLHSQMHEVICGCSQVLQKIVQLTSQLLFQHWCVVFTIHQ